MEIAQNLTSYERNTIINFFGYHLILPFLDEIIMD